MIFQSEQYKIDVDVERTRCFYEKAVPVNEQCPCDGCQNFAEAIQSLPNSVKTFFSQLGADLKKISECYVLDADTHGNLHYGGICHICGTLLDSDGNTSNGSVDPNTLFHVSPDLQIALSEDISLLEEDFPTPVIQLDLYVDLPWVLEKENTYIL